MEDDDWADIVNECHDVVRQACDTLEDTAHYFSVEETIQPADLSQLYDMAEDAAVANRLRRAETALAWRQTSNHL